MNGAIIAALNEQDTIGDLVTKLKAQGMAVCVIDDGSTDKTGSRAKIAGAVVIRHPHPLGIGKSLMDGWHYSLQQRWDYTVQIDAGGSHDPEEWQNGFDSNSNVNPDVVIGSRFRNQSVYIGRKWRAVASQITAWFLNFASHNKFTDWTSGYRVFSHKALETLLDNQYMTNMHTWQIEVLHVAAERHLTISEFPITYRAGNSSMKWKTVDDLIKVYLWILNR